MWNVIGILAAGAVIALIEAPALLKKNKRKELILFSGLLIFGTVLGIAKSMRLNIPNPLDGIAAVYKPLSELLLTTLD